MKRIKRWAALVLIICTSTMLCGALFKQPDIDIDTDKHKVYKAYSIDDVLDSGAENNYGLCYLTGKIKKISENKKEITLSSGDAGKEITLKTDSVVEQVEKLSLSDNVQVCGTAEKILFGEYYVKVNSVSALKGAAKKGNYYYLDDWKAINKDDMVECTLNDGKVKYYVPKSWNNENVKKNIVDNEIGNIDGYQYVLNKTAGSDENTPESFFVCYFKYDGNLQKNTSTSKVKPIEKAIAENIEGDDIVKFPTCEKKTYYGSKYQYYQGQYSDSVQVNDDYYTEYVFEQDGTEGLVMYLYVFKKPTNIDDIMFVTRFLEIDN